MLPDLQKKFLDHILAADDAIAAEVAETGPLTALQRLQIYKNNTRLCLTDILIQVFPAVTKLVDEKFMRYAAIAFMAQHPPAGDMNAYGAPFPAFLKNFPAMANHPYVSDVAMLEWLRQEAWLSPLPEDDAIPFFRQPHVRLMQSSWPVADIWSFALGESAMPEMNRGDSFVLVHRDGDTVVVRKLDKETYLAAQCSHGSL